MDIVIWALILLYIILFYTYIYFHFRIQSIYNFLEKWIGMVNKSFGHIEYKLANCDEEFNRIKQLEQKVEDLENELKSKHVKE